jgi:hypothetical protein
VFANKQTIETLQLKPAEQTAIPSAEFVVFANKQTIETLQLKPAEQTAIPSAE